MKLTSIQIIITCLILVLSTMVEAVEKGDTYSVLMQFDINEEGKPVNIKVLESKSIEFLDKHAIEVLSKWKYKPKMVDGKPIMQFGLKVQLDMVNEDDT